MATVTVAKGLSAGTHPTRNGNTDIPYLIEGIVDVATAAAIKGSALVQTDVLQVLNIPAESIVLTAGVEVLLPADSTTATVDVGIGANTFVSGFNAKSVAGTYNTRATAVEAVRGTTGTVDVTLSGVTGTLSVGRLRVFAVVINVEDRRAPGLAKVGS